MENATSIQKFALEKRRTSGRIYNATHLSVVLLNIYFMLLWCTMTLRNKKKKISRFVIRSCSCGRLGDRITQSLR